MVAIQSFNVPRFGKVAWSPQADNQNLINALRNQEVVVVNVDTQNDFMINGGGLYVKNAESIIGPIKRVLHWVPILKILEVDTLDTHGEKDLEFKSFGIHCKKKTHGWNKVAGTSVLKPRKKPYVISLDSSKDDVPSVKQLKKLADVGRPIYLEKNTLSMWETARDVGGAFGYVDWQPNKKTAQLFNSLHYAGKKVAIVMGVATEYCVKKAVEGLRNNGFTPIVVEDAVKHAAVDALNDPEDSVYKDTKVISTEQFVQLAAEAAKPSGDGSVAPILTA